MEALRIILTQTTANYKKEETVVNKMTYPLPPISTVIGAIHNACGYKEYKPMDISIQGKFGALTLEPYTDYCFLNSVMDDRGTLVKLKNSNNLSTAFDKVAKAKKSQGNSFRTGETIQVYNQDLLDEYRNLKNLKQEIDDFEKGRIKPFLNLIKIRKKTLATKKKKFSSNKEFVELYKSRENQIKSLEKRIKEELKNYKIINYEIPYSKFASLTTSLKYYETLNNVELVLHIRSDKKTLQEIEENIYNLKSIGRSEDFVDIKDVKRVELQDEIDNFEEIISENSAYVDFELAKDDYIIIRSSETKKCLGTKYYLNKNYEIIDNKRSFVKKKVLYTSKHSVAEIHDDIFFDASEKETYIVNFI